jgi:hypothetical protein
MPRFGILLLLFVSGASASTAPTFYKDVLPLLQQHCQTCHRPGEIGLMPLLDYLGTRPWARAIRQAVLLRQMPPWFADPAYGHFSNDRSLSQKDIQTIVDWVDNGAPAGDPHDTPMPVHWTPGWSIGKPEIVFEMPVAFDVPTSGVLPYQYIILPTRFQQDTWVHLVEVRAGDRAHTHHIVASIRDPGSPWLRAKPVGVPFALQPGEDAGVRAQGEFLAGYGPGAVPELLGPGQAKLIKAGSDIVLQIHYTTNGKPGRDRSRIGLVLLHTQPRQRVLMLAAANIRFLIPPGAPDYHVDASTTLHRNATLVSLLPHMHLRGKSFEFRVRYPNGERQILLRVPRYSYDWQLSYYLEKPLPLPAGTSIECTARFDNSPNNPRNPDPSAAVRFGPQSWDEMMIGYFEVATDLKFTVRDLLLPTRLEATRSN